MTRHTNELISVQIWSKLFACDVIQYNKDWSSCNANVFAPSKFYKTRSTKPAGNCGDKRQQIQNTTIMLHHNGTKSEVQETRTTQWRCGVISSWIISLDSIKKVRGLIQCVHF
jgi:hypothetical protein